MMPFKEKSVPRRPLGQLPLLFRQLLRFNLVGLLNTAVDFGLFFILDRLGMPYLLAQSCSYGCGIANSYLCNKHWTFGLGGIKAMELLRFALVNLVVLGISVLLIYLFHSFLHFSLLAAKAAATMVTMLVNFSASRIWVFRREPTPDSP